MKLDRRQIANILDVNRDALKQIERRNTLSKRLLEKGYKLIKKYKEYNKTFYDLDKLKQAKNTKENIIKELYNVKKTDNFINYFNIRTKEEPHKINELAEKAKINRKTVINWDNNLEDKKILSKDGYYYFKFEDNELTEVTQEEYNSYWRNKTYLKEFYDLQMKYLQGKISLTQLQLSSADIGAIRALIENKHYTRVKKYKVNRNNQFYIDTIKLIEGVR